MQTFGKIIVLGEHSVVYGARAIALPFNAVSVTCKIENYNGPLYFESEFFNGNLAHFKNHSFYTACIVALDYLKKAHKNLKITLFSSIPIARGLGSSAATSISIIKAIFNHFNVAIDLKLLYELSIEAEKIAHDNPSGIDCLICCENRPYLFSKTLRQPIDFVVGGYLLIIDSNETGSTKEAISIVKKNFDAEKIQQLDTLCEKALACLTTKNLTQLGLIFNTAHTILKSLQISTPSIETIINTCLEDALGAKISGGGLGGCVIALYDNLESLTKTKHKLLKKGITTTWTQKI